MPTYEYACKGCGEHLEVVQSFRDDALTECPACGGTLRKVFSAAGLIFKGSGWHIKDYASSSSSSAGDSKGDAAKGDAAKADTKSDAKSDSKADAKSDAKSDATSSSASTSSSEAKSA